MNWAFSAMVCAALVATKLYHTSLAAVMPKPQLAVGGRLWVAPSTVPVVGEAQVAVTGRVVAVVHSLLVAGSGLVVKVRTTGGEVRLPAQLLTRLTV